MDERPGTHRGRRAPAIGGFTLVELLITIVISGMLVAVLAGAVTVVVRQESSTNDRVTDAAAAQMLALYFPRDVLVDMLANARESDPLLPTGCLTADETGFNVLRLTWSETIGGATTSYRGGVPSPRRLGGSVGWSASPAKESAGRSAAPTKSSSLAASPPSPRAGRRAALRPRSAPFPTRPPPRSRSLSPRPRR